MAAPTKNDRILAQDVRKLSLNLIAKYLKDESEANDKFRKDLILKLATNVLPRITQLEGEEGSPIKVAITGFNYITPTEIKNDTNSTDVTT